MTALLCSRCLRGPEACEYCERLDWIEWEAICDCGLHDFGAHLLDCEAREPFRYVIALSCASAALPSNEVEKQEDPQPS